MNFDYNKLMPKPSKRSLRKPQGELVRCATCGNAHTTLYKYDNKYYCKEHFEKVKKENSNE